MQVRYLDRFACVIVVVVPRKHVLALLSQPFLDELEDFFMRQLVDAPQRPVFLKLKLVNKGRRSSQTQTSLRLNLKVKYDRMKCMYEISHVELCVCPSLAY